MKLTDYAKAVTRTISDKFITDVVRPDMLLHSLAQFEQITHHVDVFKKALFYGKPVKAVQDTFNTYNGGYEKDELHFITGIVTEVGELCEVLRAKWAGVLEDETKVADELGDIEWYLQNLYNKLGVSREQVWEANIAKLKARFPEKFTEDAAINRSESDEKAALTAAL